MLRTKFDPLQSNDWLLAKYYTIGLTPCNVYKYFENCYIA
jgi:hypothetical protein